MSNLKQIGLAFIQYSQDYDERYPVGTLTAGKTRGNGWAGQSAIYVKNLQVYRCPSDDTKATNNGNNPAISYAENQAIALPQSNWKGPFISAFTEPVKTIMAFEVRGVTWNPNNDATVGGSPAGNGYSGAFNLTPSYTPEQNFYATGYIPNRAANDRYDYNGPGSGQYGRHMEGANYLLCDGHVKWYKPDGISAGLAAPTPNTAETANVAPNYNAAGTAVAKSLTFSPI